MSHKCRPPLRFLLVGLLIAGLLAVPGADSKDLVDTEFCGDDDCYQLLNVTSTATRGEIRKGYHQMSLAHHPDKTGDKSEEEQEKSRQLFVKVASAYEVLTDEKMRQRYDSWVRGGRKRRPQPGDEEFGDMPSYYRDETVRQDVKDTPAAFAAVIVTLVISIGVPVCLTLKKSAKKKRAEKSFLARITGASDDQKPKPSAPAEPQMSRKERRGGDAKERTQQPEYGVADLTAVSDQAEGGGGALPEPTGKITKLDGPWSPEEDAELIKWTAKLPGGVVDRWAKIANEIGTRTESQCLKRAAELKSKAAVMTVGGAGGAVANTSREERKKEKASNAMLKVPVQEYARRVKEEQAKKAVAKGGEDGRKEAAGGGGALWTAEEQTLLESAMRAVDKSVEDRWDQIAERVPGRSRKEVVARVKELKQKLTQAAAKE